MASLRQLAIDVGFRGTKAVAGLKSVDKSVDKTKANFKNLGQGAINTGRMVDAFGRNTSAFVPQAPVPRHPTGEDIRRRPTTRRFPAFAPSNPGHSAEPNNP